MSNNTLTIPDAFRRAIADFDAGRHADAAALCARILTLAPRHVDALVMSCMLAARKGRHDTALDFILRAQTLAPDNLVVLKNLAATLKDLRRYGDASLVFARMLTLDPDSAALRVEYGDLLLALGRVVDAEVHLRRAAAMQPGDSLAPLLLGTALLMQGKFVDAEPALRLAVARLPASVDAHLKLGAALQAQDRDAEAETVFRRTLQLQPDTPHAHNNLGVALFRQARYAEARDVLRTSLQLHPGIMHAWNPLLFSMAADVDSSPREYIEAARAYGHAVSARAQPFTDWLVDSGDAGIGDAGILRVGFVSGDLREHPVSYFLENVLAHIDRSRMQTVAYATQSAVDGCTLRLQALFCEWHDISALDDRSAAQKIRTDRIHVLVDLSGHTSNNRLPVFAWKPAPAQASWLGYFASTGVSEIGFLIADALSVPAAEQENFTEKIIRLPDTRLCFTPPADSVAPPASPLPALANGHITLGTFQNPAKINDRVLALWSRVLNALPTSRLRVHGDAMGDADRHEQFLQRIGRFGIARERVTAVGHLPRQMYFDAYRHVDFLLDTFPFPGGTTTCEALWMGVPTLTLRGNSLLSRQGASMMTAAGLADWVAEDEDDFVRRAPAHAADVTTLAALRAGLRERVRVSPLCDGARFARHLEAALRAMPASAGNNA